MKTHDQETHDNNAKYLTRMQKGLGHHSWWYTNRGPDDCINVKMHCWCNDSDILKLLTPKEKQAIDVLNIDLSEVIENEKWSIIEAERDFLLDTLQNTTRITSKNNNTVDSLDWGGRSGGWLAVAFDLDVSLDYMEGYDYAHEMVKEGFISKSELSRACKDIDIALKYINDVHAYIKQCHKDLCKTLEQPETYIDYIKDYIALSIESEAETIKTKADNLAKLAS